MSKVNKKKPHTQSTNKPPQKQPEPRVTTPPAQQTAAPDKPKRDIQKRTKAQRMADRPSELVRDLKWLLTEIEQNHTPESAPAREAAKEALVALEKLGTASIGIDWERKKLELRVGALVPLPNKYLTTYATTQAFRPEVLTGLWRVQVVTEHHACLRSTIDKSASVPAIATRDLSVVGYDKDTTQNGAGQADPLDPRWAQMRATDLPEEPLDESNTGL